MLYGFSEVGNDGWGDPMVLGSIAVGLIFIVIFGYRQLHLKEPFVELRVFKSKIFALSTALGTIANMAMVGVEMILPLYLQIIHGKSALESGLTLLPGALLIAVMSPVTGQVFDWGKTLSSVRSLLPDDCNVAVFLLNDEYAVNLHYRDLCGADVWDFDGDDAIDHQRDECTDT